jgi:hypothetical protein
MGIKAGWDFFKEREYLGFGKLKDNNRCFKKHELRTEILR